MSSSLIETIIGALVVVIIVGIFSFIGNIYRARSRDHLFDLSFVDADANEIDRDGVHPIPLGQSQHWVKVVTMEGFGLTDFNVRCISADEAAKNPDGHSPEDLRAIVSIKQVNINTTPEIVAQGVTATQTQDRHGGTDVTLAPPYPWETRKAIFLKVDIEARRVWSGMIRFAGTINPGIRGLSWLMCAL